MRPGNHGDTNGDAQADAGRTTMPSEKTTLFDRIMDWPKRHRFFAILLVICTVVTGIETTTDAFTKLYRRIFGGNQEVPPVVENSPPRVVLDVDPEKKTVPFTCRADASRSVDPEGENLTFRWALDGRELSDSRSVVELEIDEPGLHEVVVQVSDGVERATGRAVVTAEEDLTVAPIADFVASSVRGTSPLIVTFEDRSTGNPTEWLWDFGDGQKSTEQNPTHEYREDTFDYFSGRQDRRAKACFVSSPLTVKLRVRNAKGSHQKIMKSPILVYPRVVTLTLQPEPYSLKGSVYLQHLPGHSSICQDVTLPNGLTLGEAGGTSTKSSDEVGEYWPGQEIGLQAPHRVRATDGQLWVFSGWSSGLQDTVIQNGAAHHVQFVLDSSRTVTAHYRKEP